MKYIDDFRDPQKAKSLAQKIQAITTRPWNIMEVCGGQTHSILRYGLDQLLPQELRLIHGPGCPVCVTPIDILDRAIEISARPEVILCTYGDMLRVPGSEGDLLSAKARGAELRIVYSPLDAVEIAAQNPEREIVFFAVGFETTAPANGMAVFQAASRNFRNFSMLSSHVLVPPAMIAVLQSSENQVQGFLAAGHVCTIMGYRQYESIAAKFRVPIIITGFEPLDILQGIYHCILQLEKGMHCVENQYARAVQRDGNLPAQKLTEEVFEVTHKEWRGLGNIPDSGLQLRGKYEFYDAEKRFPKNLFAPVTKTSPCISGLILQGIQKPDSCPEFGRTCTPEKPLGATMVSTEGACSAYYRYRAPKLELQRINL